MYVFQSIHESRNSDSISCTSVPALSLSCLVFHASHTSCISPRKGDPMTEEQCRFESFLLSIPVYKTRGGEAAYV